MDEITINSLRKKDNISINTLNHLYDELRSSEVKTLIRLTPFVSYHDNVLRRYGRMNMNFITYKDISDIIDVEYGSLKKTMRSLVLKNVIKRVRLLEILPDCKYDEYCIVMNPWIYCRTSSLSINVLKMFSDTNWKSINEPHDKTSRNSFEYKLWEYEVFNKYNNECFCCGNKYDLEAHHIESYASCESKRLDVNNGMALCKLHHNSKIKGSFHNVYGTNRNTIEQLNEYLKNNKK